MKKLTIVALFLSLVVFGGFLAKSAEATNYYYYVKVVETGNPSDEPFVTVHSNLTAAQAQTVLNIYQGVPIENAKNDFDRTGDSFSIYTDDSGITPLATKYYGNYQVTTSKTGYTAPSSFRMSTAANTYAVGVVRLKP